MMARYLSLLMFVLFASFMFGGLAWARIDADTALVVVCDKNVPDAELRDVTTIEDHGQVLEQDCHVETFTGKPVAVRFVD